MQKTEKFFIFSWKELTVIILLVVISLGFFFTLGLHYGKKLHGNETAKEAAGKLEESPENVPPKDVLENGAQHSDAGTTETVKSATQEELAAGGLKVEQPKPVDFPNDKLKAKKVGVAVAPTAAPEVAADKKSVAKSTAKTEKAAATESVEEVPVAAGGKFAIQLGSYPTKKEAQLRIATLIKRGLHAEIRTAVVNEQTRFRVVLPGFKTKALADQQGKDLHGKRKIENFIVIKSE